MVLLVSIQSYFLRCRAEAGEAIFGSIRFVVFLLCSGFFRGNGCESKEFLRAVGFLSWPLTKIVSGSCPL